MKKGFMDENFLLDNEMACRLYHEYAAKMPIVDYHCHLIPEQIAKDARFENITEAWLGGDHYKWRLMRANGVDESYITGGREPREKFLRWAETLEQAYGNPLYHWSHLELQRYFGYHGVLNRKTAAEVWEMVNAQIVRPDFSARQLMIRSRVRLVCTTDDPVDTLEWHRMLREERTEDSEMPVVLPAFRPDKALMIENDGFNEYMEKLSDAAGLPIRKYRDVICALENRIAYFRSFGCRAADHGIPTVPYRLCSEADCDAILEKKLSGQTITATEALQYRTMVLLELAKLYHTNDFVMQLHVSVNRNTNRRMFTLLGADTGYDCISADFSLPETVKFLSELDAADKLPRTILYSLNPCDNAMIDSLIGCFQGESFGKIQHGSAWWFNDHLTGMQDQMTSLANIGLFGSFIGMLTDSRSFLSYPRHEYFRRILCNMLGTWAEKGLCPDDEETLSMYVKNISYENAMKYLKVENP